MNKNPHNNQDNEDYELLQELVKALDEALYEEFLSEPDDKDNPEKADIWDHVCRNALFDDWHY